MLIKFSSPKLLNIKAVVPLALLAEISAELLRKFNKRTLKIFFSETIEQNIPKY